MKTRKLKPENITKSFRKFSGDLSIQIDGKGWIDLKSIKKNDSKIIDEFLKARNTNTLEYVEINEDKEIVEIKLKRNDESKQDVINKVRKVYRHG